MAHLDLVTGSSGFIGTTLAEQLVADGRVVRGIDVRPRSCAGVDARIVDLVVDDLVPVLTGVDVVYHLAGRPGVQSSWGPGFADHGRDNIAATQRLLDAAVQAGVRRVVLASSSSVYGSTRARGDAGRPRPTSPYGVSKLAAEHLAGVYGQLGLDVVILRLFTVYGPRQRSDMAIHRIIDAALGGPHFDLRGDGRQRRAFTYVDDVVAAARLAAGHQGLAGAVLDVGAPDDVSLADVIARVEAELTAPVPRRYVTRPPGDPEMIRPDLAPLRALGWEPRTRFAEGLARQIHHQAGQHRRATRDLVPAGR